MLTSPLPEILQSDLEELLSWDNHCFLRWTRLDGEAEAAHRWFQVSLSGDGRRFGLSLEFWVPSWMREAGVAAILPAHLSVTSCEPGRSARVDLPPLTWADLEKSLPRVSRTCARLMNELWGRTDSQDVLLETIDHQPAAGEMPYEAPQRSAA